MKRRAQIWTTLLCAAVLVAGSPGWAQHEDFYFWRWGHMDGPHDSSKALGISRDGRVAVGATVVVDFTHAWRSDIDWAIATDDGVPPLYNELQVQEDLGVVAPSRPSAAYAASDMTVVGDCPYDKENNFDWCGSLPVGGVQIGNVPYAVEWYQEADWTTTYAGIPDFGGGATAIQANDVTPDGLVVVGVGNNRRGPLAFRADFTDPLLPVVKPLTITDSVYTEQTLKWSVAEAVSADGMIIAGYGGTKTGSRAFVTQVLDPNTDPITLLSVVLPKLGGGKWNEAYAMTPDGAIVAGRSDSSKGPQACIWFVDGTTGEWAVKGLGGLSKKSFDSVVTSIAYRPGSAVGELIAVGQSKSILYPEEALVWTGNPVVEDDGIGYLYDLEYILTKTGAGELSGMGSEWILNAATGVSVVEGETRIVGWGVNPEGGGEAWVVTGFPFDELVFTH